VITRRKAALRHAVISHHAVGDVGMTSNIGAEFGGVAQV